MKFFILMLLISSTAFSSSYIVKFKKGFLKQKGSALLSQKVLDKAETSFGDFVAVDAESLKHLQSLKSINQEIEYIEPNITFNIPETMNEQIIKSRDARFSDQWGLKNTGVNSGSIFFPGVAGKDINAEKAWNLTKGDQSIIVAVIDTGVDYLHEDLKDNILVNEAELNGVAGEDSDGNGYVDDVYGYDFANSDADPMDDQGHGTHCAGIIGAVHGNTGIMGTMANVKILPIKFLTAQGGGSLLNAVKSIEYAIVRGAHIMSNSWGGTITGSDAKSLTDAVLAAEAAGIVFVAAAGNSNANNNRNNMLPANIDASNVISVGAMNGRGRRSSFSNYGSDKVHVFAPGSNILSTMPSDSYKKLSGTSMAAPFVSGIAGLLLSLEPNLTPAEVRERIIKTSAKESDLANLSQSNGRVDALRALENNQQ